LNPKTGQRLKTDLDTLLLEIEMAKIEEIFLPYMINPSGETFFERIEQRGFLLEAGEKQ